jgi:hypothetical protein
MADAEDKNKYKKMKPVSDAPQPLKPEAAESLPTAEVDEGVHEGNVGSRPQAEQERDAGLASSRQAHATAGGVPALRGEGADASAANRTPLTGAQPAPEKKPDLVRASQVRAAYEHPFAIRLTHWVNAVSVFVLVTSGLRIFRAFPSFGPKIPGAYTRRMAGWRAPVALHFHVALCGDRSHLYFLSVSKRPLSHSTLQAQGHSRRMADGSALLLLWAEASCNGTIQSAAEAGVHVDGWIRGAVISDRTCLVQTGAVFVAGISFWRIPLVEFLLDALRMEARAGIPGLTCIPC